MLILFLYCAFYDFLKWCWNDVEMMLKLCFNRGLELTNIMHDSIYIYDVNIYMGWNEMGKEEIRWGEMTWSEKCEVQVWRVEVQMRNARCMWNVKKVFSWYCRSRLSHAGHVPGRQECNTLAHSAHARAWLTHNACKFYRCERSFSISLRQLPPRLVRVLLEPAGYRWV